MSGQMIKLINVAVTHPQETIAAATAIAPVAVPAAVGYGVYRLIKWALD